MTLLPRHTKVLNILAQYGDFSPVNKHDRKACEELLAGGLIEGQFRERNRDGVKRYMGRERFVLTKTGKTEQKKAAKPAKKRAKA